VYLGYQSYVKPPWTTFKIQLAFSNRSVFSADLSWLEWKELFSSGRSMPWGLGHTPCPSVDMVELTANIRWALSPDSTSERIAIGIELSTLSFKRVWVGEATAKDEVRSFLQHHELWHRGSPWPGRLRNYLQLTKLCAVFS